MNEGARIANEINRNVAISNRLDSIIKLLHKLLERFDSTKDTSHENDEPR